MRHTWSLIGAGAAGTAVAALLARRGHTISALWSRRPERAKAAWALIEQGQVVSSAPKAALKGDWLLFAVPDDALADVAAEVAREGGFRKGQTAVHLSGSRPAEVLKVVSTVRVGSLHPIQTIPTAEEGIARLKGSFFGIEGEETVLKDLDGVVRDLGGIPVHIPTEKKALYHAAVAMASNHVTALEGAAVGLLAKAGLSHEQALHALQPLLAGTVEALAKRGLPGALTGPVARGDAGTVTAHLLALRKAAPDLAPLYVACALEALVLARAKGLDPVKAAELGRVLGGA